MTLKDATELGKLDRSCGLDDQDLTIIAEGIDENISRAAGAAYRKGAGL